MANCTRGHWYLLMLYSISAIYKFSIHKPSSLPQLATRNAIWMTLPAAALIAFSGWPRLGERLIQSSSSPEYDVSRSAHQPRSVVNEKKAISFHLPWTKTTGIFGSDYNLTAIGNLFSLSTNHQTQTLHSSLLTQKITGGHFLRVTTSTILR